MDAAEPRRTAWQRSRGDIVAPLKSAVSEGSKARVAHQTNLHLDPAQALATRALDWLVNNLDQFQPLKDGGTPDGFRQKALGELATVCMYLRRNKFFAGDSRCRQIELFVLDIYSKPTFHDGLFRFEFLPQVLFAATLRNAGLLHDDYEWTAIQELCDSIIVSEYAPHRLLSLRYFLDLGGFAHRLPSYSALCKSGILSARINLIYATDMDVYALTHALFYCSDFGARRMRGISKAKFRYVSRVVDRLLTMYIHRGDWDLVGELLLSAHCLRATATTAYAYGCRALTCAQRKDGAVPGPGYQETRAQLLRGTKKARYTFEKCYHTTLVAALVGALCPLT